MDISLVTADSTSIFQDQLNSAIGDRLKGKTAKAVQAFAQTYYEHYPLDELDGRRLSDVYGSCFAWWNYCQSLPAGSAKVRVFNPNLEEDGWPLWETV